MFRRLFVDFTERAERYDLILAANVFTEYPPYDMN